MFNVTYLFILGLSLVVKCHSWTNETLQQSDLILNWIYSVQNSTDDQVIDAIKLIGKASIENETETTEGNISKEEGTTKTSVRTTPTTTIETTTVEEPTTNGPIKSESTTVEVTTQVTTVEPTPVDPMILLMGKVRSNEVLVKAFNDFASDHGKQLVKVSKYQFPPFYAPTLDRNDFYWDTKRKWGLIVGPFVAISAGIIVLYAAFVWYELFPHQLPLHPTMKTDDD